MFTARAMADRLAELLAGEHACMADFLEVLAEFDGRRGWEELGYSSLFAFLRGDLHLSTGAAYVRSSAAMLLREYPEVLEPLRDGRLCLSTVGELVKVVTKDNASVVVPRFYGISRREAAAMAASIRPIDHPPVRDMVCSLPTVDSAVEPSSADRDRNVAFRPAEMKSRPPASVESSAATSGTSTPDENAVASLFGARPPRPPVAVPRPPEVVPLDADLRRLHVTVSRRLLAKLDLARDALSHSHPGASTDAILEVGLDLVLERHRKRRGVGATAAATPRRAAPERITADVKRRVWERDGGRCQWSLDGGVVCGSTLRLEFDHRVPRSLDGGAAEENVRLLCRFHDQRAARLVHGDAVMDRFTGGVPRVREVHATYGPDR